MTTDVSAIPPWLLEGMNNYVQFGIPNGDFLEAVFANDLMGAMGRADEQYSRPALHAICTWIYQYAPMDCRGSRENAKAWIKAGGAVGLTGRLWPVVLPADIRQRAEKMLPAALAKRQKASSSVSPIDG